ncbi:MAG: YggT family protein [Anaerolineae bacterium]
MLILIRLLGFAIFIRVVLSWLPLLGINIDPRNPIVTLIHDITEPILGPLRQILPRFGMMDISPLVAILIIVLVERAVAENFG